MSQPIYTKHAQEQMAARRVTEAEVEQVLAEPQISNWFGRQPVDHQADGLGRSPQIQPELT